MWSASPSLLGGCGNVLVVELAKEVLHTWFPWQPQQLARGKQEQLETPVHHKCPSSRGVPFVYNIYYRTKWVLFNVISKRGSIG